VTPWHPVRGPTRANELDLENIRFNDNGSITVALRAHELCRGCPRSRVHGRTKGDSPTKGPRSLASVGVFSFDKPAGNSAGACRGAALTARCRCRHRCRTGAPASHMAMTMIAPAAAPDPGA
jgi:hypothetical protein